MMKMKNALWSCPRIREMILHGDGNHAACLTNPASPGAVSSASMLEKASKVAAATKDREVARHGGYFEFVM